MMTDVAEQHNLQPHEPMFSWLTPRTARVGLIAVLLAAVLLGVASLQFGSNEDALRGVAVVAHNPL